MDHKHLVSLQWVEQLFGSNLLLVLLQLHSVHQHDQYLQKIKQIGLTQNQIAINDNFITLFVINYLLFNTAPNLWLDKHDLSLHKQKMVFLIV